MILTTEELIEAPLDQVFSELSDFETLVQATESRGVVVRRTDDLTHKRAGMTWEAAFEFRGRRREADVTLSDYAPPRRMVFDCETGGLFAQTRVDCAAPSPDRTRVTITSELSARSISARLLLQSLKLAKGGVEDRFRRRIAGYARDLEDRLIRAA